MPRPNQLSECTSSQSLFTMTKSEIQSAVAAAAQTDKKTAGIFLDTLSAIAYKATKKNGEFVVPGFGKLVKQKRKSRNGINPSTKQKINRAEISRRQGSEGCDSRSEEVDGALSCSKLASFFAVSQAALNQL